MDIQKPKPKPSPRRKLILGVGGAALLVAVLGVFNLGSASPSVERNALWIDTAQRGDMLREIRASGTLIPKNLRWIAADTTAVVQDVLVEAGAKVEADTVILRLSNPTVLATREKARAALAGAQAEMAAQRNALTSQLLDQQAALAKAESTYQISQMRAQAQERAEAAGVMSKLEASQSRIVADQERGLVQIERQRVDAFRQNQSAQMQAAQARRDEAASALAIAEQEAQALEVRAGIAGTLQQLNVEPGQRVEAGAALARVARPDELIARLQVPEVLAKDLSLDLAAAVDTHNGVVQGRIARIDPAVRNGKVTVDVHFDRALPKGARPDLSVDGRIVLDKLQDVLSIGRPAQAIPDGASELFVLRAGDDVARRVRVTYGAASSERIQVRSGLNPGDQAILSDTAQWQQYDELRLQ
ncbi:efflux RND transporter periplasmic adaptor subunit [Lysobacter sp. 5GHs7-4]|uniref:efflux RND transporter periplasmic adaptor subunit n=1 Tax=Lysobacter sp. 5GHs7-4 TaxID=2904253 RepID=UPI001E508F6A|nr:HlyD family efflux transporter periplasmic adaptor subunit [Lysobacter sp. 5GHs7-4]UHQ23656.1 efflux RND transporter periplasmic adaptor subunit [Lysobacter sp. 5GHs7-4]